MFRKNKRRVVIEMHGRKSDAIQNKRQKIKRLSAKRKKTTSFLVKFLGVLFFGAAFYVFLFSSFTQVDKITIEGCSRVSKEGLLSLLENTLSGRYGRVLGKNNFFLIPKKEITTKIDDQFKLVEKVEIIKKFPNQVVLRVLERTPQMIICGGGGCFLVDEKGQLFDFEENQEMLDIPKIKDESRREMRLGDYPLDLDKIKFVTSFFASAKNDLGLSLDQEIFTPGLSSGDLRLSSQMGWRIFVTWDIAWEKEIEMLRLVLENKLEKEKRPDLEYIDIRTLNKVYYKFKSSDVQNDPNKVEEERPEKK